MPAVSSRVVCKKEVAMVCETHHFDNPRNTAMTNATKDGTVAIELMAPPG